MKMIKILTRRFVANLTPVIAFCLAILCGVLLLLALGVDPVAAFHAMMRGAFGNIRSFGNTIVKATPILFVGLGICIAFRAGVLNIGGEGQMIMGGLAAVALGLSLPDWQPLPLITVCCVAGTLAGALWGAVAGVLKAYLRVNEVLSTIMLNYIAVYVMNFLLNGPLMDPEEAAAGTFIPQCARLPDAADLPRFMPTRAHWGVVIAIVLAVLVYFFLWRTTVGFRLRLAGKSQRAALNAGINVHGYVVLALLLGGAFAGLGGAVEVLGVRHNMFSDSSMSGFTTSAGFNGIVAALFGQLHPLGTIPAAGLLGALLAGANKMQRALQIPSALVQALNGMIVLFVVGSDVIRRRMLRKAELGGQAEDEPEPPEHLGKEADHAA